MLNMQLQTYTDWNVQSVFKRIDRNKYAYRVVLTFKDGTKQTKLCSGFATKKEVILFSLCGKMQADFRQSGRRDRFAENGRGKAVSYEEH